MRERLAQARTREAAERWVAQQEKGVPVPDQVRMGAHSFRTFRLEAFVAGAEMATEECSRIHRAEQDDWGVERATGQRQLDDATALMREAAELLRSYEAHHRAKADAIGRGYDNATIKRQGLRERLEKAERNALMAARLEAWLAGEDRYPVRTVDLPGVTSREQAERMADWRRNGPWGSNVRPVERGPLADPDVVEGLLAASGQVDATCPLSLAKATAFRLQTPDPRFDPSRPVCVNGFLYHPATEA